MTVPVFRARFALPIAVIVLATTAPAARAQQRARAASAQRRSPDGRRELLAVPAGGPIRIDGDLDEPVWKSAEPSSNFVQSEPLTGQPATEATDVWVAFDVQGGRHDRQVALEGREVNQSWDAV